MRRRLLLLTFSLLSCGPALAAPAAPEPGELVRTVRVLVQNIYGRREQECQERYKALAAQVLAASPAFDMVALNEHWKVRGDRWYTCDADVLTKALEADGRYAGTGRSVRHKPRSDEVLETSGGNSIFTKHRITDSYEDKFVNGRSIPLSGFLLARVEVAPGVTLDVWNAHLEAASDGCDGDCRWEQATDFAGAVETFSGTPDKGERANPVLIVGDFNTGGPMTPTEKPPYAGNAGYENVMEALGHSRDLWLERGTGSGYTYDCSRNTMNRCKTSDRIDYVLLPEDRDILNPDSEFILVPLKVDVVRWLTPKGKPISDHYGLDATLEVRRRPKAPASGLTFSRVGALLDAQRPLYWDEAAR